MFQTPDTAIVTYNASAHCIHILASMPTDIYTSHALFTHFQYRSGITLEKRKL